jgi:hypothetical protein
MALLFLLFHAKKMGRIHFMPSIWHIYQPLVKNYLLTGEKIRKKGWRHWPLAPVFAPVSLFGITRIVSPFSCHRFPVTGFLACYQLP